MGKLTKLLVVPVGLYMLGNVSHASMLDQIIYNVVGQASNAAGARLGDEIYYGSSSSSSHKKKRRKKKHTSAKRNYAPKITDEMRIQKSLSSLGFYRGRIDGQVNSFETRSAIKKMNIAYGISNSASLKSEAKDTLIFLGTLFEFDRHLISTNNTKRAKNRKIQVALKLHGYYQGNIDGAIGRGTRGSIAEYKRDNGMNYSGTLDFEEEYQLISTAKEKNDKNIEDAIASLESIGRPVQQYGTVSTQAVQHQANSGQVHQKVQQQAPVGQAYQRPQAQQTQSQIYKRVQVPQVQGQPVQATTLSTQQTPTAPVNTTNTPQTLAQ